MAERIAAEIFIGGKIPRMLVPALLAVIGRQFVGLDWGEDAFCPERSEDLLENCSEVAGTIVLRLCDDDACYGAFPELETFLREDEIAFDRYSEGKYEFDPEWVSFRPATGLRSFQTNAAREVVVAESKLGSFSRYLARTVRAIEAGNIIRAIASLNRIEAHLKNSFSFNHPPLPAFEIDDP